MSWNLTLNNEGLFATWKQLDGSLKFEQIVDVTSQTIWAQTSDGKIYSRGSSCYHEAQCNTWAETKEVPNLVYDGPEQPMIKSDSCQSPGFGFSENHQVILFNVRRDRFLDMTLEPLFIMRFWMMAQFGLGDLPDQRL